MSLYLTQLGVLGVFLLAIRLHWRRWQDELQRCYGAQAPQQRRLRATAIKLCPATYIAFATVIPGSIVLSFALAGVVENVLSIFFIVVGTWLLLSFGLPAAIAKRNGKSAYDQYVEELGRISLTGFHNPIVQVGLVSSAFIVLGFLMLVGRI